MQEKLKHILFVLSLGLLILGFKAMLFEHIPWAFNAPEEDMSHGYLVPLVSLYILYVEKDKIKASLGEGSLWGLLAMLPALFLGFFGTRGSQLRFEEVGFIGLLLSLTWCFYGLKTVKRILFPCLYLLFCLPLATFLDVITVHLRIFATSTAFAILHGLGTEVVQQGTMIVSTTGDFAIDVANPCSGMRSIFALLALSAAYAYFNQPTWAKRGVLFLSAIPLAILGNVMRILTIVLVAAYADKNFAIGFYHDYSGYIVFIVAIALMLGIDKLLKEFGGEKK